MALAITIEGDSSVPLYSRLAQALIKSIEAGQLQPGEALPSVRSLSATLSLAPLTVHRAYQELLGRGYAETVPGVGTFVSYSAVSAHVSSSIDELGETIAGAQFLKSSSILDAARWSKFARSIIAGESVLPSKPDLFAILYQNLPTKEQMPLAAWRKAITETARQYDSICLEYSGDAFGFVRLRKALAGYLRRARGVGCNWEQIAVFSGSQHPLDILCRLLLDEGDVVAMEEPGYMGSRRTFLTHHARLVGVPVDEEGISLAFLNRLPAPPKILYVTPSHQDPLGMVMTVQRRNDLIAWAERVNSLIVEDDNDCEFRHSGPIIPALQSMDVNDRVVYMNSFWRSLGTMVRVGYMIIPRRLLNVYTFVKSIVERDLPLIEQNALADLIEAGHLERQILKNGRVYRKRLHALLHAAALHLKGTMALPYEAAGMRIIARFDPARFTDEQIMESACDAEFPLFSTNEYYYGRAPSGQFLIPFGQFDEETIAASVKRFAASLPGNN